MYLLGKLKNGTTVSIKKYTKSMGEVFCSAGHKMCAKKGLVKSHHFAHYPGQKCDPWRQGMTEWHLMWQDMVTDKNNLEVLIKKDKKWHIADIVNPNKKLVIEIQHSPISLEAIKQREKLKYKARTRRKIFFYDYIQCMYYRYVDIVFFAVFSILQYRPRWKMAILPGLHGTGQLAAGKR